MIPIDHLCYSPLDCLQMENISLYKQSLKLELPDKVLILMGGMNRVSTGLTDASIRALVT